MAKAWLIITEKEGVTTEHPPCLGMNAALEAIGIPIMAARHIALGGNQRISLMRRCGYDDSELFFSVSNRMGFDSITVRRAPEYDDSLHTSPQSGLCGVWHPRDERIVRYTAGVSLIRRIDDSRPELSDEVIREDGSRPNLTLFPQTSLALMEPSMLAQWLFIVEGDGLMATLQAARDKLGQLHAAELAQRERRRSGAPIPALGDPPACLSDAELRRRLPTIRTMISANNGDARVLFPRSRGGITPTYEVHGHYFRAEIHFGARVKTVQDYLAR